MRIESGRMWVDKNDTEWKLLHGTGKRTCDKHINFGQSFSKRPRIVLGLTYADFINDHNHRIKVYARDITSHGFTIEIETWADTHIWGAGVDWMAYGD